MHGNYHYRVAGFLFRSDFPISELGSIDPGDNAADVQVRKGSVPASLTSPTLSISWLAVSADECRLEIPSIGRFFIRGGVEVVVDPDPAAAPEDLDPYLLGIVVGVICHQRGLLALHANAVEIEDGCVAFVGPSGAGKSTLTGFLSQRGYRMVTDDVCLIRFHDNQATVCPTTPRLKLWKNTLNAMGHESEPLKRVLSRLDKFSLPVNQAIGVLPLRRVYVLAQPAIGEPEGIRRVTGAEAIKSLMDNLYHPEIGWATRGEAIFAQCRTLLNTVECYRLTRRLGFDEMGTVIDRLEEHFVISDE